MPAPISIVIPTLNAGDVLPETANTLLPGIGDGLVRELVVSDGGSTDDTGRIARELGAVVLMGPAGRGGQIARAVATAKGDWLLILDADTHLSPNWPDAVRHHMAAHGDTAGWFPLRFQAEGLARRIVAASANLRARWLLRPIADQGLFVRKDVLASMGGVPDAPHREELIPAHRLKGRLGPLTATATTTATR